MTNRVEQWAMTVVFYNKINSGPYYVISLSFCGIDVFRVSYSLGIIIPARNLIRPGRRVILIVVCCQDGVLVLILSNMDKAWHLSPNTLVSTSRSFLAYVVLSRTWKNIWYHTRSLKSWTNTYWVTSLTFMIFYKFPQILKVPNRLKVLSQETYFILAYLASTCIVELGN